MLTCVKLPPPDKKYFDRVIKILDEKNPGWYKKVKLDLLTSLMDSDYCILGQVYGRWTLPLSHELFGESAPYGHPIHNVCAANFYLNMWRALIAERQNGE